MFCAKSLFSIFLPLALLGLCKGLIDMEKYNQMPALYTADDYNECLQQEGASYCMVYSEIEPDNNSLLWRQLNEFQNSYRFFYRHDQLYSGLCTTKCRGYPQSTDSDSWDVNAVQPQSNNVQWAKVLHEFSQKQKTILQYQRQLHECVNDEMQREYNLSVRTFVKYCDNPSEPFEKGAWYIYSILIIIGIGVLNILSTLYDFYLKSQQSASDDNSRYYDGNHKNGVNKYLTAFSFYRNYRRLVLPNNSAIGKDLRFVDGFRTIMSFTIVFEHAALIQFMPIKNSEFFENIYSTTFFLSVMHIVVCIELFFVLTGLMLQIKFSRSEYITPRSSLVECVRIYVRMMISRYLRYLPSVLFLILFTSNILLYLQNGPFWRHIIETNVVFCRNKWWSNLFMTANSDVNTSCWMHTWYIAADFQLYAIFLIILIITAKYPQYKKFIYTIVGVVGFIQPSIVSYMNDLNSAATITTENYRHMYFQNITDGIYLYLSTYSNMNSFFVGVLCGEIYMKYLKYDKYKEIVGRYLRPLPAFGWMTIFFIWYIASVLLFKEHSIWIVLFPMLNKHLSVIIVATIVILLNMCKGDGFLTRPIFRILSRISYQVYLWHFIILFMIFGKIQQPLDCSLYLVSALHLLVYTLAAILSFFITIMVEYPIAELLAGFDLKNKPKEVKKS